MQVGGYYDRYWTDDGYNLAGGSGLHDEVAHIFKSLVRPDMRVIDLGWGNGWTSGPSIHAAGASYVGVDVSATAVATAWDAGFDARVIEDASALPFDAASFDMGVCIEVLEHLFRPDLAAAELARVLRPGAWAVFTVPNVAFWRRRTDLALFGRWHPFGDDRSIDEPWRDPHIRFFAADPLKRMLERSGFADVAVHGHAGGLLREIPLLRRVGRGDVSAAYRRFEHRYPALLASRCMRAVAVSEMSSAPDGRES